MFNILLWQSMRRILAGIVLVFVVGFLLPSTMTERLWIGSLFGLACPLLVLGRRRSLNREVYAVILSSLPHPRRWQIWGLSPAFFIIALWSVMIAQGSLKLSFTLFCWGVCCVSLADLFDKRKARLGDAWSSSILSITILVTAPFWGALWFGRTVFSPWIATLCLGAHPTISGLKSLGMVALQDPLLYRITQSGLVEIQPLPWWAGAFLYLFLSFICLELTVRSLLKESV